MSTFKYAAILSLFLFTFTLVSCEKSSSPKSSSSTAASCGVDEIIGSEQGLSAQQNLGKVLYFDPRLSEDGTLSCNSCHNVMNGGSDNRAVSAGIHGERGGRNSPTVFNATFLSTQFWDGRAKNLTEQAKGPILNLVEMGGQNESEVVSRIKSIPGYTPLFKAAYPEDVEPFTYQRLAEAIAAYETTLTTLNSPYDQYKNGQKLAMSDAALKGMKKFETLGCKSCHMGDHFAGPALPEGTGFFQKFPTFEDNTYVKKYKFKEDLGRFDVSKEEADKHMFRVPTLRNVELTAPYFHNGSVNNLKEAIKVMAKTQLNQDLNNEDVNDINAFLLSLTGTLPPGAMKMPTLPKTSGMAVGKLN